MRATLTAVTLIALGLATACGNDKAPTEPEIAQAIRDSGLHEPHLADCAAKIYSQSGMSPEGLRDLISKKTKAPQNGSVDPESAGMSKDDAQKATAATQRIVTECAGGPAPQ